MGWNCGGEGGSWGMSGGGWSENGERGSFVGDVLFY